MARPDLYMTREIWRELPVVMDMRIKGATYEEIRQYLNVGKPTMQKWEKKYKAFGEALRVSTNSLVAKLKSKLYQKALKDKKVTITVKEVINKKTGNKDKLREVKVEDWDNFKWIDKSLSHLDKEYREGKLEMIEKNTIAGTKAGKLCLELANIEIPNIEEEQEQEVSTVEMIDDLTELETAGLIQ